MILDDDDLQPVRQHTLVNELLQLGSLSLRLFNREREGA